MVVTVRICFSASNNEAGVGLGSAKLMANDPNVIACAPSSSPPSRALIHPPPKPVPQCYPVELPNAKSIGKEWRNKVLYSYQPPPYLQVKQGRLQRAQDTLDFAPPSPDPTRTTKKRIVPKNKRMHLRKWVPRIKTTALTPILRAVAATSRELTDQCRIFVDDIQEYHCKMRSKERISACIVNLRAASERTLALRKGKPEEDTFTCNLLDESSSASTCGLRSMVGEVGLTLFSPLDMEACEPLFQEQQVPPFSQDQESSQNQV